MPFSAVSCPRFLVAGLSGGSGKTLVSLGLTRAFADSGLLVQTFKKGPDYIDARWLALASRGITHNLDPFLCSGATLQQIFAFGTRTAELAIIEGNRGLYDGKDLEGSCSSAALAKSLRAPVIVVADCTKVTRTMAALLGGLQTFDPQVDIRGVILNKTAGGRHQQILRQSVEKYTSLRVLGVLPRMRVNPIPERFMGLTPDGELGQDPFALLASALQEHVDIQACLEIAKSAPSLPFPGPLFSEVASSPMVRIGVVRDAALWFYYEENLAALRHNGAELVEFSLLGDEHLPDVDALYLGGGFPETQAESLAANQTMRAAVVEAVNAGMPVYAECGGLMYLAQSLEYEGASYPMSGIYPLVATIHKKPQGHGYLSAVVTAPNPFYIVGEHLSGHEFHYSRCPGAEDLSAFIFQITRGQGMAPGKDCLLVRNCLAGYTHMHALGNPDWAHNFVAAAQIYRFYQQKKLLCPDIRV